MNTKKEHGKIDWMITLVPLAIVIALCVLFFFAPEQSNAVLSKIRFFFGDTFGTYYLVIGLGIFILSLYIAGSKYGNIVLGELNEKPKYSFFAWGSMMFTCGLAADILFYSFSEWVLYATDPHLAEMGSIQDWAAIACCSIWTGASALNGTATARLPALCSACGPMALTQTAIFCGTGSRNLKASKKRSPAC